MTELVLKISKTDSFEIKWFQTKEKPQNWRSKNKSFQFKLLHQDEAGYKAKLHCCTVNGNKTKELSVLPRPQQNTTIPPLSQTILNPKSLSSFYTKAIWRLHEWKLHLEPYERLQKSFPTKSLGFGQQFVCFSVLSFYHLKTKQKAPWNAPQEDPVPNLTSGTLIWREQNFWGRFWITFLNVTLLQK